MTQESCCICAKMLADIPPLYNEKSEKPIAVDRNLPCCGRVVCGNCIHVRHPLRNARQSRPGKQGHTTKRVETDGRNRKTRDSKDIALSAKSQAHHPVFPRACAIRLPTLLLRLLLQTLRQTVQRKKPSQFTLQFRTRLLRLGRKQRRRKTRSIISITPKTHSPHSHSATLFPSPPYGSTTRSAQTIFSSHVSVSSFPPNITAARAYRRGR